MFTGSAERRDICSSAVFSRGVVLVFWVLSGLSLHAGIFTSAKKPDHLVLSPAQVELNGASEEHGLLVTAVMSDGSSLDVTDSARFTSKRPKVVSVSTNGICRPISGGEAEILVEFGGRSAKATIVARAVDKRPTPSFRQDVLPILTKTG